MHYLKDADITLTFRTGATFVITVHTNMYDYLRSAFIKSWHVWRNNGPLLVAKKPNIR